jgi:hypothetical protein
MPHGTIAIPIVPPDRMRLLTLLLPIVLALSAIPSPSPASPPRQGDASQPAFGVHGMALFGGDGALYASHLPMFHAPHDTQLVLRVRLDDPSVDTRLRAALETSPALWTFVPEPLDLHRIGRGDGALMRLRGDIVEGHFERGGTIRHADVVLHVDEVVVDRRLDARARAGTSATYRLLDAGDARFAVKLIDARPDYEHIARIDDCAVVPAGFATLSTAWKEDATAAAATMRHALATSCPAARIRTVYFETADLR